MAQPPYYPPPPQMMPVPAPSPSVTPPQNPITIVGPQFLAPYPVELVVTKKLMTLKEGQFSVTDVNGSVIFSIKGSIFSVHDQRVILDAAGNPLLTLRQKLMTAHNRWLIYRGESSNRNDLLFSVKRSSLFQFKTSLNVYLTANTSDEQYPDFVVKGNFFERGCTIYQGNTNTVIAQMHRRHSVQSILFDKDTYGVTVSPHVDYAFITALIVVLHEINADRNGED